MCISGGSKNNDGKFHCSFRGCKHSNKQRSILAQHYVSTHLNQPYVCNLCNKTFVYVKTLQKHMKTHAIKDSKVSYTCPNCGDDLETEVDFKIHISKCTPKYDASSESGGRSKHKRSDKKMKPSATVSKAEPDEPSSSGKGHGTSFVCSTCEKSFSDRESLVMHIITCKITEDNVTRKCPVCTCSFVKERHYRVHMLNFHVDLFNLMYTQ